MDVYNLTFILFLLLIGVPCLLAPKGVQKFVLTLNARFGYFEPEESFRKSEKYVSRLRKLGVIVIGGAILLSFAIAWTDEVAIYVVEKFEIGNAL
tara:strand:- start:541 stop:825 length:285 start_codon:yes stop_codon:yes gene_type:complete